MVDDGLRDIALRTLRQLSVRIKGRVEPATVQSLWVVFAHWLSDTECTLYKDQTLRLHLSHLQYATCSLAPV